MLYTIFELTLEELRNCTYKEDLIDKSTRQYVDKIDIRGTIAWLELERTHRDIVPGNIINTFPNTQTAKIKDIIDCYIQGGDDKFLFVNGNFEHWNYEDWKLRQLKIRQTAINDGYNVKVCFYGQINNVPVPVVNLLNAMTDWADLYCSQRQDGLFPVARIGNKFFFTDVESQLQNS